MDRPSIFGSAVKTIASSAGRRRKRRMRSTKSRTSSSPNALSSESIGTACRTLANPRAADLEREALQGPQVGKAFFDRVVAPTQPVILGVRHGRRIVLVVALVVRRDLALQPRMLGLGLLRGQAVHFDGFGRPLGHGYDLSLRAKRSNP